MSFPELCEINDQFTSDFSDTTRATKVALSIIKVHCQHITSFSKKQSTPQHVSVSQDHLVVDLIS
jgi:hypothetical protein